MAPFIHFVRIIFFQAIPHAVAMVRGADGKSPREAVEFVLQLLKVELCLPLHNNQHCFMTIIAVDGLI